MLPLKIEEVRRDADASIYGRVEGDLVLPPGMQDSSTKPCLQKCHDPHRVDARCPPRSPDENGIGAPQLHPAKAIPGQATPG